MLLTVKLATLCLLFLTLVRAQDNVTACPVGSITMAGADSAELIVKAWSEAYSKKCSEFKIETEGGGYPLGAARVCGNHPVYDGVDLGGMYGPFFYPQALTDNEWSYNCRHSERETILVSQC